MTLSPIPEEIGKDSSKRTAFRRAMSRKKSIKMPRDRNVDDEQANATALGHSRAMSRKRSICEKLMKSKDGPVLGSRAPTGKLSLKAKEKVILKFPALAIDHPPPGSSADALAFQGPNSIKAEIIDFNAMLMVMLDNNKMLTHTAVERFFEWIPIFALYLERYMLVEEEIIMKWVEGKADSLKGELRPSARMVLRGKMQKEIHDVQELQDIFKRHLPAGERLNQLLDACDEFTNSVLQYCSIMTTELPAVLRRQFTKEEVDKTRIKFIKHVVQHTGYQDFITLYTRWMRPGELLEWKTRILFPCDFKFFSYSTWEKDMDAAHYQIAAQFGEILEEENAEQVELNKQSKADFDLARATRQASAPAFDLGVDGLEVESAEEEEYEEDEE